MRKDGLAFDQKVKPFLGYIVVKEFEPACDCRSAGCSSHAFSNRVAATLDRNILRNECSVRCGTFLT
jgi:hypothetical protein